MLPAHQHPLPRCLPFPIQPLQIVLQLDHLQIPRNPVGRLLDLLQHPGVRDRNIPHHLQLRVAVVARKEANVIRDLQIRSTAIAAQLDHVRFHRREASEDNPNPHVENEALFGMGLADSGPEL